MQHGTTNAMFLTSSPRLRVIYRIPRRFQYGSIFLDKAYIWAETRDSGHPHWLQVFKLAKYLRGRQQKHGLWMSLILDKQIPHIEWIPHFVDSRGEEKDHGLCILGFYRGTQACHLKVYFEFWAELKKVLATEAPIREFGSYNMWLVLTCRQRRWYLSVEAEQEH
jgi:hypothetical protein